MSLLILAIINNPSSLVAQTFKPITTSVNKDIQGYWEYLPAGYDASTSKFPLLIFCHGIGEVGTGSQSDLQKVLKNGTPAYINSGKFPKTFTVNGKTFSFIVVCPQMVSSTRNTSMIQSLIDYCVAKYKVDQSRIYLTGLSQGGGTVWQYSSSSYWQTNAFVPFAKRLAAAVPVCGNYGSTDKGVANIVGGTLPVWAIHNSGDNVVNPQTTIDWINNLNTAGVRPNALMTILNASGHNAWTTAQNPEWRPYGLSIYEWMLQYSRSSDGTLATASTTTANKAPISIIKGKDSLTMPVNYTTLDGSMSTDADGTVKKYAWKYISGPVQRTTAGDSTSTLTISGLNLGTYMFQLKVTDDKGACDSSRFTIAVNPVPNKIPVAIIKGIDSIRLPLNYITLDGSASSDSDGTVKSYLWKCTSSNTTYTIDNANVAKPVLSNLAVGKYSFQLTVTDDKNAVNSTSFNFTVYPAIKPVVIIKSEAVVQLPTNSIALDASASYSPNGSLKKYGYSWKYVSGPTGYKTENSATSKMTVNNLQRGIYVFKLTITDVTGATGCDSVSFTVKEAAATTSSAARTVINNATTNAAVSASSKLNLKVAASGMFIGPVPAKDNLQVSVNDSNKGKVLVRVTDMSGRVVMQQNGNKDADQWKGNLNVSSLTTGAYFIETLVGSTRYSKEFIK